MSRYIRPSVWARKRGRRPGDLTFWPMVPFEGNWWARDRSANAVAGSGRAPDHPQARKWAAAPADLGREAAGREVCVGRGPRASRVG